MSLGPVVEIRLGDVLAVEHDRDIGTAACDPVVVPLADPVDLLHRSGQIVDPADSAAAERPLRIGIAHLHLHAGLTFE